MLTKEDNALVTNICVANVDNDYKIDRVAQKYFSYPGIICFPLQDIAMMEDQWGPLADRTLEHLTRSDFQIIAVGRRLLKAVKAFAAGIEPSEPWRREAYACHRASVVTQSGTLDEAVAKAKALATESRVSDESVKIAPAIRT